MQRRIGLTMAVLFALAAAAPAREGARRLVLLPQAGGDETALTVLEGGPRGMRIELNLSSLDVEDLEIEGEQFQALDFRGARQEGEAGQAGLPVLSRLVAIPDGVGVTVRARALATRALDGFRPLPVQSEEAQGFAIDRAFYAGGAAAPVAAVTVGEPAIFRDLRVVPVTFRPLSWDAQSGVLTVSSRLEAELEFSGRDERNAAPPRRALIPTSFDRLYRDTVLGYEEVFDRMGAAVGQGTWLAICPSTAVYDELQPLVDWRKRQGYNVIVTNTGETGTSEQNIKTYIQNIYNTVDPPLEHVVLAGDAGGSYNVDTWHENVSGYGGPGDHYFVTLAGSDILADAHVGRLSYGTTGSLTTIVNKILNYEANPTVADPDWFSRASLTGDPGDSGMTCIWVNQSVKRQLIAHGYAQIDTIWSGNFPALMAASINRGCSIFGYRGFYGVSGLTTGYIDALTNGGELPFAVLPTCDSGQFENAYCRSEAFLRNANGGGIGAIGTSTSGTHTRYNNSYYAGAMEGAVTGSTNQIGPAHTRGKLSLYQDYYAGEPARAEYFAVWNNLMGDPATDMWTGFPAALTVSYPATLPVGANAVPVSVLKGGTPLADALVCLFKDGEISVSGWTDFNGETTLPIAGQSAGQLLVTVTKHNCLPHRGAITLGGTGAFIAYAGHQIDDDASGDSQGNNDDLANPAETIELPVQVRNVGTVSVANVTGTLSSEDPLVTITDAEESFGTIPVGGTAWSAEDFDIVISPDAPDGYLLPLTLTAHGSAQNWVSLIQLGVRAAAFAKEGQTWGGGGATLDPGESGTLSVTIRNNGSIAGNTVTGVLDSASPFITVTDVNGSFGTIAAGATAANTTNPFALSVSSDCFQGHEAAFTLTLICNGQARDVVAFTLTVGTKSSDDPSGPDAYGYYAFDNTDTSYPYAPTYNWIEIAPNHGGAGTDVGLSDFGWEQDDIEVKTLPFTFRYYGRDYTQISICSNGYVVMGTSSLVDYMNRYLPGTSSPGAMIAPFWDNLYQVGSDRVYHWNDAANHRYVVQWSRLRNEYSNASQNIELVLYDPVYHPTETGDGEFWFQYNDVNNTDARDAYATVGIQNHDRTVGLLYNFWAQAQPGAASLADGRALRFLPVGMVALGHLEGDVTNASNGGTPVAGVGIRVLEAEQILMSQADGHYAGGVLPGVYTVRAEHPSFDPVTVTGVEIVENQTRTLDFSLVDIQGPSITETTAHPFTDDTEGPYVIESTITDYSAITELGLHYKINGGGNYQVTLALVDPENDRYRAEIPGYPTNTLISYWIEAEDVAGNLGRDPEGTGTYDFYVLDAVQVLANDFETDQGWTVGDAGDDASSGLWTRVNPNGIWYGEEPVQPEDDATPPPGVMCYITGNDPAGSNQGAEDVDGGKTTLLSPVFDLTGMLGVQLSYQRWYTNDTGNEPGQDYWVVQVTDDGSTWVDLENTNVSQRSWVAESFLLDDYIDLTATVRLRFIASDEGGGSVVEAGVDEVYVIGYLEPEPTDAPDASAPPARLTLLPNLPNPFNPETAIRFGLPAPGRVSLDVYDVAGRRVRALLADAALPAGYQTVSWDGRDDAGRAVSTGLYFYVLRAEGQKLSGKMTLLK